MTFKKLLESSGNGLPHVKVNVKIFGATSDIGKVVIIHDLELFKGCAVKFPGKHINVWFSDEEKNEQGKRHMSELSIVQ